MTTLPEEPQIQRYTSEVLTLELDEDQVAHILVQWAKSRGFTHRAVVDFCMNQGAATITETRNT